MLGLLGELAEGVIGGTTWGVGFVAVTAAAVVGGTRGKPLAKRAIKGYLAATQRAREWTAETAERVQDLYAEARYEYESELRGGNGARRAARGNAAQADEPPATGARRRTRPRGRAAASAAASTGRAGARGPRVASATKTA